VSSNTNYAAVVSLNNTRYLSFLVQANEGQMRKGLSAEKMHIMYMYNPFSCITYGWFYYSHMVYHICHTYMYILIWQISTLHSVIHLYYVDALLKFDHDVIHVMKWRSMTSFTEKIAW